MEFVRVKKRGQVQKHQKTWLSVDRHYKIAWARECFGVRVQAHYHATVNCLRSIDLKDRQWDFAGRRGPYKTFEAAVEACNKHHKAWTDAIEISEGERTGRSDRLRSLEFRVRVKSIKDKKVSHQKIMTGIPVWVRNKANPALFAHFFPRGRKRVKDDEDYEECATDPSVYTPVSETSAPNSLTQTASVDAVESSRASSGLASDASGPAKSTTKRRSASTKPDPTESPAPSASAPVKGQKKPAASSTKRASKGSSKKTPSTTPRKRTAKAA